MPKRFALALLLAITALLTSWQHASAADRPNLIFLLTDDQRWDALGCMGNPVIKTPNIDRLAKEGVVFENAFATTAICATSRASFITGQYARRHGIVDFRAVLSPEAFAQTFPAVLKANGYQTAFIGKWGVGNKLPADEYDYWKGFAGQGKYFVDGRAHMTKYLEGQTLEFLDTCTPEQPFCLQVSFKAAHCQDGPGWQFQHAEKYTDYYADDTIVAAETANDEHYQKLPKQLQGGESRVRWERRFDGDQMLQKNVKDYYRLLTGVDDFVGAMVAKLEEKKLADNTVIVFTSDHGFFLGEHGLAGKWLMYEESIRIPMIVFDPRLPKDQRGQRREELVLSIDVAPTLLTLAGIEPPSVMQGESLTSLVDGTPDSPWRTEFLYEHLFPHKTIPQSEGVRDTRWKYVFYPQSEPTLEQLFDLQEDPHEVTNLADDAQHAEKLKAMRGQLEQMRTSLQ
ncbi:sulfatase [Bremerella sp. JC770]|uniref:sulfatase family protein n=1 Tax=Bremerella sp. JC770 TaxID=3232137 RepID=UPI0034577BC1